MPVPKPPALRTVVASPKCAAGWKRARALSTPIRGRPVNACATGAGNAPSAAARSVAACWIWPSQSWGWKPPMISRVRLPTASRYSRSASILIDLVRSLTSGLFMPMPKSFRLTPRRLLQASSNTWSRPASTGLTKISSARATCHTSQAMELRSSRGRTRICSSERPFSTRSAAEALLPPTATECMALCCVRNRSRISMVILLGGHYARAGEGRQAGSRGGQALRAVRQAGEPRHRGPDDHERLHHEAQRGQKDGRFGPGGGAHRAPDGRADGSRAGGGGHEERRDAAQQRVRRHGLPQRGLADGPEDGPGAEEKERCAHQEW